MEDDLLSIVGQEWGLVNTENQLAFFTDDPFKSRKPFSTTRMEMPASAAMAAQRDANPAKVSTTKRTLIASDAKIFWRIIAIARRE